MTFNSVVVSVQILSLISFVVDFDFVFQEQPTPSLGYVEILQIHPPLPGVNSFQWDPTGQTIASVSEDGALRRWHAESGNIISTIQSDEYETRGIDWNSDATQIATCGTDNMVRIWDAENGELVAEFAGHERTLFPGLGGGIASVVWSPDDRLLASGGYDASTRIWDAATGDLLHTLRGIDWPVVSLVWSDDGSALFAANNDGIYQWNADDGSLIRHFPCAEMGVQSVVLSPDGTMLAAGHCDGRVQIWNTETGALMKLLVADLRVLVWHRDGRLLAGTNGYGISVFDVTTDEVSIVDPVYRFEQPVLTSLIWHPDGTLLAGGDSEGFIHIWSLQSR